LGAPSVIQRRARDVVSKVFQAEAQLAARAVLDTRGPSVAGRLFHTVAALRVPSMPWTLTFLEQSLAAPPRSMIVVSADIPVSSYCKTTGN
jgi:hypothetical protein